MKILEQPTFWNEYWGELISDKDSIYPITLFGFENHSAANAKKRECNLTESGTYWGFLQSGSAEVRTSELRWNLRVGQWFCVNVANSASIQLAEHSRMVLILFKSHVGLQSMGGPIEALGRLRYIDGCTDTLLYSPPIKGDPCLNLLHFPTNIDQTAHLHPSSRTGMISSGYGVCVTKTAETPLIPGGIFYLPKNVVHKFRTNSKDVLNVVSFHPDSDWGPTHEVHPMINRTWVNTDTKSPELTDV